MRNFKRLSKNVIWMMQILPAFMQRFDSLGQENPQVPDRLDEIYAVVDMIDSAIEVTYNKSERMPMFVALNVYRTNLAYLVSLDRNANPDEVTSALQSVNIVLEMMLAVLQRPVTSSKAS